MEPQRMRYQRHTPEQVQGLERAFNGCPKPNEEQRKQLANMLGMEPLQVKFWFQNKRTKVKAQLEFTENHSLRLEYERLRAEQLMLTEALHNTVRCVRCGRECCFDAEEILLLMENQRLRGKLSRLDLVLKSI